MPGDEDKCAHYALAMMAVYVDDDVELSAEEYFSWQFNVISSKYP